MMDNVLNNEKPKEEKEKQTGRVSIKNKLAKKKQSSGRKIRQNGTFYQVPHRDNDGKVILTVQLFT